MISKHSWICRPLHLKIGVACRSADALRSRATTTTMARAGYARAVGAATASGAHSGTVGDTRGACPVGCRAPIIECDLLEDGLARFWQARHREGRVRRDAFSNRIPVGRRSKDTVALVDVHCRQKARVRRTAKRRLVVRVLGHINRLHVLTIWAIVKFVERQADE